MPEIAENTALFFVYSTAVLSHIPCMAYGEQNRARVDNGKTDENENGGLSLLVVHGINALDMGWI